MDFGSFQGRQVVVTGMGAVSPLGANVAASWRNVIAGKSGIVSLKKIDNQKGLVSRVAGEVIKGDGRDGETFDPLRTSSPSEVRRNDPVITYLLAAGAQAVEASQWSPQTPEAQERSGIFVGTGIGGFQTIAESCYQSLRERPRVGPFSMPSSLPNIAAGSLAIRHRHRGTNLTFISACASSANALGEAARAIASGDVDIALAGGSEAAVLRESFLGFSAMRALSHSYNDCPQRASRPWDKGRDGFVIGEGAAVLLLEERSHAEKRGAEILCELAGYGTSCDAHHISTPQPEGKDATRAMRTALTTGGVNKEEVGYVNAHATSTPVGDEIELRALKNFFGTRLAEMKISSTKSATGHLLGAAGALEAIFSIMALRSGVIPPTLNLDDPDPEAEGLNLVAKNAQEAQLDVAISNSFGFGGVNVCLAFRRWG